jgi:hypothetical protein
MCKLIYACVVLDQPGEGRAGVIRLAADGTRQEMDAPAHISLPARTDYEVVDQATPIVLARPSNTPIALPLLHVERGFGKAVHLPCLSAATIPIDLRVAERDKPQRQIVSVEAFRVPANRNDRQ